MRSLPVLAVLVLTATAPLTAQGHRYVTTPAEVEASLGQVALFHVGPEDGYATSHIPGARHLDLMDISIDAESPALNLELPPLDDLARRWAALGVSSDTRVVLYWANGWATPTTRAWLTLDRLGLGEQARIMDGGLEAWVAEGRAVSTAVPAPPAAGRLQPRAREVTVDKAWLAGHYQDAGVAVVDARAERFYTGEGAGSDPRTGHIPGAGSAPYDEFVTDSRFGSTAEWRQLLTAAGAAEGERVVVYCHIGQQASMAYFAARNLGMDVRLFDGSFEAWSRDWSLPVVQDELVRYRLVPPGFAQRIIETPQWSYTIIDARSDLGAYLQGHLDRAVFLHNETLRWTTDGIPADLMPGESYRALFERLGVRLDTPVLVYGQGDTANFHATFVAWLLGALGHPNVALLDGGWARWTAEGRPVTQDYPTVGEGHMAEARFAPELATIDDVRRAMAGEAILVDARPASQFTGESGPQRRRGHIPGAIRHTWSGDLRPDSAHTFKPEELLAESYRAQGITPDREIIVYCNTGTEASHLWFALRHVLGYENVKVYVPSWTEYVRYEEMPVETGE